jgi:large subunit ribosomal protein L25
MNMTEFKLVGTVRTKFGKGASRQARFAGQTPAVIYGHKAETRHITVDAHESGLILRHKNALIEVTIDGKPELVLVKSVSKDPVTQIIEHIDLVTVVAGEKVHVEVPIHIIGESLSGTTIDLEHKTVKLVAEATHVPEFVEIHFNKEAAGHHVLAKDVTLPKGVSLDLPADELVASVVATAAGHAEELAAAN